MKVRFLKDKRICKWLLAFGLCLLAALCFVRGNALARDLQSQQQAQRWQGESQMDFGQVSCFLPANAPASLEQLYDFRQSASQRLTEAAVEGELQSLYRDCWSAAGKAAVSSPLGSGEAEILAVGGDFFQFHPVRLLSGSYLQESDLMQDRVLLDEDLAWLLFGGTELQGLSFKINGQNFVVAGVIDREQDEENAIAWQGEMGLFMSYEAWSALNEETGVSCYEFVMAQPVKDFAISFAREKFPVKEAELLDNTARFSWGTLWDVLGDFGRRSMQQKPIAYPYWENAARYTEDHCALLLLVGSVLSVPALLLLAITSVRLFRRGKRRVEEELIPRAVESTQEAIRVRQRRRWERKRGLHEKR